MLKKLFRILAAATVVTVSLGICHGSWLSDKLGCISIPDFNVLKAEFSSRIDKIEADVKLNNEMVTQLGVNNQSTSNTTRVGGDQENINTITNSDTVVMGQLDVFKYIIGYLLFQMVALLKFQSKLYTKLLAGKDEQIARLVDSRNKKEDKLDLWQNAMIERCGLVDTAKR